MIVLARPRNAHDARGYVMDNPWTIASGQGWSGVASFIARREAAAWRFD